ncbi:MAG: FkbM family methyltransferase [Pseudomonadota bacterium]
MLKHRIASAVANMGASLGMASDSDAVRALIASLHPVKGGYTMIRLGAPDDGGYVLPDDFDGIAACYSPGVDNRATFEKDLIERGVPCYMADASCETSPLDHPMAHFLPKYLGVINDDTLITLEDWVGANTPGDADLLLQMDIEGAEWPVLLNAPDAVLRRFRIIVLEAHFMDRLFDRECFTIYSAVFARLLRDFAIVHNHPNNYGGVVTKGDIEVPRALEITLLRKDRVTDWDKATQFPHLLDVPCAAHLKDVVLPKAWHG